MVNARHMYLRPGNLFKDFFVEADKQKVLETGRIVHVHGWDGTIPVRGCLADASYTERANHNTKEHVITHTIVQAGSPRAKRGDRLVLGSRKFYIVDVDEAGALGISTIYYVEERLGSK